MKFYDEESKRLILLEQKATPEFWNKHWQTDEIRKKVKAGQNNWFIKNLLKKFLKPGAKILEGGCGIGQNVYGLNKWGYKAYGVDFAKETIEKVKAVFPELILSAQDVRNLDFPDNFFDGYWSLGIIEHFWEGYDEILKEAKRVIKPGGYLFLTFPYMSPLRKLKARLGFYKIFRKNFRNNNFYEFILDSNKVRKEVEKYGFKLCLKYPFDATKGIKDEISLLRPILQKIYNSQSILAKGLRFLVSLLFSKIAGHSILLVFRKNEK